MDIFRENKELVNKAKEVFKDLENMNLDEKIKTINAIKKELHKHSPFQNEPVDCVTWEKEDKIKANDYNPNNVAPTEMELLEHSIKQDGFTQPIVTMQKNNHREVVDGFHRTRVSKESEYVKKRNYGYCPVVTINHDREERNDRIAATIRHNRARGKHRIDKMSDIVIELKRRNWSDKKIAKELGMDQDEVLRLTQITGLADMFKDEEFSEAWKAEEMGENYEQIKDKNDL